MKIIEPAVRLLRCTPFPEKAIEEAGRLCWKSEENIADTSYITFIRMLLTAKHESVLEHASAGFIITTDRGISHELVRHRLASYSQTSTRYCNYSSGKFGGEITVIQPSDLPTFGIQREAWVLACHEAERFYMEMLDAGCKPQVARSVLPTCLATEIAMTANFREWRHFLTQRLSPSAHPDMRVIAEMIRDHLKEITPIVFEEF